jgi:hypothetical protein
MANGHKGHPEFAPIAGKAWAAAFYEGLKKMPLSL